MLRDSEIFTLRNDDGDAVGLRWWMPKIVRTISDNMLTIDEPDHTRLRAIVDEAFHRRAVLEMEPRILAIAGELADELFAEGSPADLVDRYAQRLPLSVICELLGLPLADRRKFTAWANGFARLTGAFSFFSVVPKIFAIMGIPFTAPEGRGTPVWWTPLDTRSLDLITRARFRRWTNASVTRRPAASTSVVCAGLRDSPAPIAERRGSHG